MASNFLIGLLAGLSVSVWVYSKVMRSTGGNVKNSMIVGGSAGVGALVVVMMVLGAIFK